jgi:hypothetical protein
MAALLYKVGKFSPLFLERYPYKPNLTSDNVEELGGQLFSLFSLNYSRPFISQNGISN